MNTKTRMSIAYGCHFLIAAYLLGTFFVFVLLNHLTMTEWFITAIFLAVIAFLITIPVIAGGVVLPFLPPVDIRLVCLSLFLLAMVGAFFMEPGFSMIPLAIIYTVLSLFFFVWWFWVEKHGQPDENPPPLSLPVGDSERISVKEMDQGHEGSSLPPN